MSDLSEMVEQYNDLIRQWNDQYSNDNGLPTVTIEELTAPLSERLIIKFSSEMTGRKKVSMGVKLMHSYNNINDNKTKQKNALSRGELATLIISQGKQILSETRPLL